MRTFEQLEPRNQPTIVIVWLDAPSSVTVGEQFTAELWVREYDPSFAGLAYVALDVAWNPDVLRLVGEPRFTDSLPLSRSWTLEDGRIDNLNAGSSPNHVEGGRPIGNLEQELFATLTFEAIGAGPADFAVDQGSNRIAPVPVASLWSEDLYFDVDETIVHAVSHGVCMPSGSVPAWTLDIPGEPNPVRNG